MHRSLSRFFAAVLAVVYSTALTADQVRRQGPVQVPIEVSLKVGGATYAAKGLGSCTHAPKASIFGVLSEMWSVRQQADGRSLQLTLWKPTDGSGNMFSLSVNGAGTADISTVRGGDVTGTGSVTLAPAAKGGTLTVNAKAKNGDSVAGTIKCEAFTPHIADGGN